MVQRIDFPVFDADNHLTARQPELRPLPSGLARTREMGPMESEITRE